MGSNTLNTIITPKAVEADDINQFKTALTGDFMPRNATTGAIEDSTHNVGSAATQWKDAYFNNLFLDGVLFDPDNVGTGADASNAIVSGAVRSGSSQPDFLRASGSGANMTILATATPLQITANSISVTISADIAVSSLTLAPSTNNTALINDTALAGGDSTKYTGEHEADPLKIDTVGTEITDRIGQYICLKTSTEYMLAFVESATTLRHVYRGFFFDSSGNPLTRVALSNNDTLTIMSLGWVFMDANGTTVDVSYKSPSFSGIEPSSPATDDYWFDQVNRVWKRYDGADFQTVSRMLIGLVVIDGTNCVATRSFDFTKVYSDLIEAEVEVESNTVIRSKAGRNLVSVYGAQSGYNGGPIRWDITTDLESGLTEANSTVYYLYLTEQGVSKISTERPLNREADLRGWYHPYHSWRYIGVAYNDSSGHFSSANSLNSKKSKRDVFTSAGEWIAIPNRSIRVIVVGGGGGGGGATGTGGTGGTSTFGTSLLTSAGGAGGLSESGTTQAGGTGGSASGGDININGGAGGVSTTTFNGYGGASFYSVQSGQKITTPAGTSGQAGSGKGGGGAGSENNSNVAGSGGGGGATVIKKYNTISGRYAVSVGSGGASGSGTRTGGAGSAGIVEIEYL